MKIATLQTDAKASWKKPVRGWLGSGLLNFQSDTLFSAFDD
jgi:hypothetical protein